LNRLSGSYGSPFRGVGISEVSHRPSMWARWYGPMAERIRKWAADDPNVRAVMIIGSQARTNVPADEWSDLDVVIFHADPARLIASTEWFEPFGSVVLSMVEPTAILGSRERRVLYSDGRDVDFAIFPSDAIPFIGGSPEGMGVLGRGFVVLVDKDQKLAKLSSLAATPMTATSQLPTENQFRACVADFWYHFLWFAKKLRRGEAWMAKLGCDGYLKQLLAQVIEWNTIARHDKNADVWHDGRFLDRWADPAIRARLPATFSRYDPSDLARALGETGRLFSELAHQVAESSQWSYPADVEKAVQKLTENTLKGLPGST